jgi:hypothetical protein
MSSGDYRIGYDFGCVGSGVQRVWKLATAFAEVALRRRGPESLPDSTFLVIVLMAVDLSISIVALTLDGGLAGVELMLLAVNTALFLLFTYAVLTFFKLERRFRQTVSAILGADIWITLAYLPLALLGLGFGLELATPPFAWVQIAVYAWAVYISAWVLARSLSQPLIVGFMFEILYVLTWLSISDALVPPAAVPASTST